MKTKDTEVLGRELNWARPKPDTVDRPVRTARIFVHHYNSTQYCKTETVFSIFPFLHTNITSQMWPSGGKGKDAITSDYIRAIELSGRCIWHWLWQRAAVRPSVCLNVPPVLLLLVVLIDRFLMDERCTVHAVSSIAISWTNTSLFQCD